MSFYGAINGVNDKMERMRNKLFRRGSQNSTNEPMDTSSGSPRENPENSYLSLTPSTSPSTVSLSQATLSQSPDPLTQQVDLLTEENSRLQEAVQDLTTQLNSIQESQLSMISKCDDLTHSLELERRRFVWQKNFYEKKILDIALCKGSHVNGISVVDGQEILDSISNSFYHETILDLVAEQENKESQIAEIKSTFEEEIKRLTQKHETDISELVESNHEQVKRLVETHEELIKDLLTGCEGLFDEMKVEYLLEAETNTELKTKSGRKIWDQFQGLSTEKKGVIVAGICIITIATAGWASWGFIIWVWPRLLVFAEAVASNPEVLGRWLSFLIAFLNSSQFQTFVKTWEEGQPIGVCLKPFLNTDMLSSALQMAPNLFAQLKNRSRVSIDRQLEKA